MQSLNPGARLRDCIPTPQKLFVRSLRGRAEVDVQFHFSPSLLTEVDPITKKHRSGKGGLSNQYLTMLFLLENFKGWGPVQPGGPRHQGALARHRWLAGNIVKSRCPALISSSTFSLREIVLCLGLQRQGPGHRPFVGSRAWHYTKYIAICR
jgi:hypothetical protein